MIRRFACLSLLLWAAFPAAHAALHATVDNPQVARGDTIELTLTHEGQSGTDPDLTPLKQDFDIVSRSTSTSMQIMNGSASSSVRLALLLAPKRSGPLIIPAITWGADRSTPIAVTVGNSSSSGQQGAGAQVRNIFLETTADPKSPYVQAAVHVTVRIFIAAPLSHANLEFPTTDAVAVRQTGADQNATTERDGQLYQVVVRHYVLTPQHSGHLVIPGPVLSGEVVVSRRTNNPNDPFSGFFGNSPFGGMMGIRKPIKINGDSIVLDVQPRPEGVGSSYWLPARNVTLAAQWTPAQTQVHVGDPVTVNLHLQAQDATSVELPDLSSLLQLPPGMKAYPDEPKLKDSGQDDTVVAERDQSVALIADQPGQFTLPELRLSWWDTRANQVRQAVIPARTIEVTAAPGSQASLQAAAPTEGNTAASSSVTDANITPSTHPAAPASGGTDARARGPFASTLPWPWISLALGLLWVGTLIAWLTSRKRSGPTQPTPRASTPTPTAGSSRARNAFQSACRGNDALAARRALLSWANALAPEARIAGLSALAKRVADSNTAGLLRELDRACYVGGPWNGAALGAALQELTPRERAEVGQKPALAPLYQ